MASRKKKQNTILLMVPSKPLAYIPTGPCQISVNGVSYTQQHLHRLYQARAEWFSLTPRNEYQRANNYGVEGDINVNPHGTQETNKENWLGSINAENKNIKPPIFLWTDSYSISVSGKIERSIEGKYELSLFLPYSWIYSRRISLSRDMNCRINIDTLVLSGYDHPCGILIYEKRKRPLSG